MILVLGATGFIGRHLVAELAQSNPGEVRALVRKGKRRNDLHQYEGKVEIVEGDILDLESLRRAMKGVDVVFDFAQVTANFKNKNNLYQRVNVEGTANVVKAAQEAGVKHIILGSGLGTVPAKAGSYMQTRWEAEELVRKSGLAYTILQPSILFGKGSEFFEAQARVMKLTWPVAVVIGNGKTRFQPVYVGDVVRAAIESMKQPDKKGKTIQIGGGEYYTIKELIAMIARTLGKKRILFNQPLWLMRTIAGVFNLLPSPPLTPATLELFSFDNTSPDPQIIEHEFGFKPAGLKDYLAKNGI